MKVIGKLALGWNGPRRPVFGTEFSGTIEATGTNVSRFRAGDAVFAFPGIKLGGHAQYALIAETGPIAPLPKALDFHQAAALSFGGSTALHFLRKAGLKPGQSILVIGGSGAVGLAMVQLARQQGARVSATTSTSNLTLLAEHGVTHAINYTSTDIATLSERFDIVADTVGALDFAAAQKLLNTNGRYLAIAGTLKEMLMALRPDADGKRMIAGPAEERVDDVAELARLAAAGIYWPHIDRVYPFSAMPEAHAYVETRRKRGSVVIAL